MQCNLKGPAHALVCSLAVVAPCSHAINGAQPGGRGVGNASMGGASIALPLDAISPANNPAGLSVVPDSVVMDLQVFHGRSSADYVLPDNHLSNRQRW
jgi:long-chain fatty acid transport protein